MIPPLAQMPRELWTWQVDVEVADLSTHEKLAAAGLRPPDPDSRDWQPYQRVGEQLATNGWAGLLAPSAARPDGKILCLFRNQRGVVGAKPLFPPSRVDESPAPPRGLRT
jgi:RES domain-containing protein